MAALHERFWPSHPAAVDLPVVPHERSAHPRREPVSVWRAQQSGGWPEWAAEQRPLGRQLCSLALPIQDEVPRDAPAQVSAAQAPEQPALRAAASARPKAESARPEWEQPPARVELVEQEPAGAAADNRGAVAVDSRTAVDIGVRPADHIAVPPETVAEEESAAADNHPAGDSGDTDHDSTSGRPLAKMFACLGAPTLIHNYCKSISRQQ